MSMILYYANLSVDKLKNIIDMIFFFLKNLKTLKYKNKKVITKC